MLVTGMRWYLGSTGSKQINLRYSVKVGVETRQCVVSTPYTLQQLKGQISTIIFNLNL